ncbi:unnamed protein product [Calicophoron daubneyi]|uniref:Rab-GAP TBC domain-containing protein n=1 Tax=Calicophoron daubneyi TaxID=300641 RepID=A0AAV2TQZ6_CALDB
MGDIEEADLNHSSKGQEDNGSTFSSDHQYDRYGFCGGKEYTDPDVDYRVPIKRLRAREMKWRDMCQHWEFWAVKNRNKLRERCRKGIPDSMRCEAWQRLCSSPMVLVARPKVLSLEVPETSKQRSLKKFFGTLNRNSNSKSLPTIITTSPSFRIKRGKPDERRKLLLRKLYGNTPTLPPHHSRYSESVRNSPMLFKHDLRSEKNVPDSSGDGDVDMVSVTNRDQVFIWPPASSNGDSSRASGRRESNLVSGSTQSLRCDTTDGTASSSLQPVVHYSGYSTLASVHESSCSPGPVGGFTAESADQNAVASSSGGYASLSTNSGTDSASIRHELQRPRPSGMSIDSYGSSLASSSAASSFSILWHPAHSNDSFIDQEPSDPEDARATLVPTGDPDPAGLYEQYCMQEGERAVCDQIRRDIDRQFPFHELFSQKGGHGQESLYTLLKAYTVRHADKGYCQGQAPLAAVLLMFMPEVDAFWTFNEVCERYLEAYYDDGLERIQIDGEILYALLRTVYPAIYKYLRKNGVDPIMIVLEWFMCVYTRTLPWPCVLRVLDMFFCEGKVILFRVALVLLRRLFGTQAQRRACPGSDEILFRLKDIPSIAKNPEELVRDVVRIGLSPQDVAQEAIRQSHKWEKNKEARCSGKPPLS